MSSSVTFEFKHEAVTRVTLTEEEFLEVLKKKNGDTPLDHSTMERLCYEALFNRLKRRKTIKMPEKFGQNEIWSYTTIEDDCVLDCIRGFVERQMASKIESKK